MSQAEVAKQTTDRGRQSELAFPLLCENIGDLSLEQFVAKHPKASSRLRNGIRMAAHEGALPYVTVNQYLAAGPLRIERMLRLQNLGMKSVTELDNLIAGTTGPSDEPIHDDKDVADQLHLTLLEFLLQRSPSIRLLNSVRYATEQGKCPFNSVADYLRAGVDGPAKMLRIPNLGRGTAQEFDLLAKEALHSGARVESRRHAHSQSADLDASLLDFLKARRTSVRLLNAVRAATADGTCPFATVAEYVRAGADGPSKMLRIPNLGRGTAHEFDLLVKAALSRTRASESIATETRLGPEFDISLLDFLELRPSSIRLSNAIRSAAAEGKCPFATVSDYIRAGVDGVARLKSIPNLGSRSADEFDALVKEALHNGTIDALPNERVIGANGYPNLEILIDTVLSALRDREMDVLIDRIKSKKTLEEVANELGITRERVRQIETKALEKIRRGYGRALEQGLSTVLLRFTQSGTKQCSIIDFAALASCDVMTAELFFSLAKKLDLPGSTEITCSRTHLIRSNEFSSKELWTKAVREALLRAPWPLDLGAFLESLPHVPQHHVEQVLCDKYDALIVDGSFSRMPKLTRPEMCVHTLLANARPMHISSIRAEVLRVFSEDMTEHHVNATVGRLPLITITGPGTYAHYSSLSYSEKQIEDIRNAAYEYLSQKEIFISAKVLFDDVFSSNLDIYPDDFNYYLVLGFVQDDPRFVTKRGNMIGLLSYDLATAFTPLEEEVRNLVLKHGPISVREIYNRLKSTRKLCNDGGIRIILDNTPTVVRVGRRTYDCAQRVFGSQEIYEEMRVAVKVSLLGGPKAAYTITTELQSSGLDNATMEIVESVLSNTDAVFKDGQVYRLERLDDQLRRYEEIATDYLAKGQGHELQAYLSRERDAEIIIKLFHYDGRFHATSSAPKADEGTSELSSILDEFNF